MLIKYRAYSSGSPVRLLAFLLFALFLASPSVACSPLQRTPQSAGMILNENKGQELWKFETGG